MLNIEDWLEIIYPTFEIVEGRGLIPRILLPPDFRERIPRFYAQKREITIAAYAKELEELRKLERKEIPIRLQWDNILGLTNISLGIHGGLDLYSEGGSWPCFQEHNLSTGNGFIGFCVASKYISELLKS